MSKETYYFPHDYNARNDPKLQKVLMDLGHEGKSIYWDLVEILFEQGGFLKKTEIKLLGFSLRTEPLIIENLIQNFGLFESDDEKFWSNSVLKRLQFREEKKQKNVENGKKGGRPKNPVKVNNIEIDPENQETQKTQKKPNGFENETENNQRKGKERKEKENNLIFTNVNICQPEKVDPPPLESQNTPHQEIVNKFNELCPSLPRIKTISEARKIKNRTRWKENPNIEFWEEVFRKVEQSDFLTGRDGAWHNCSFDWIMTNNVNYNKVLEGNYGNDRRTTKKQDLVSTDKYDYLYE